MRFVAFAGLLSLVAAAPALEEKRQTDVSAPAFTGPPAAGFTPGGFPGGGTRLNALLLNHIDDTTRRIHWVLCETNWLESSAV